MGYSKMAEPKIAGLIQQLDTWQLNSEQDSSRGVSPGPGPAPDTRLFQKYELEMQIASLSKETSAEESHLRTEVNDLEIKLTALKSQKRSMQQAFNLQQERIKGQLRTSEEAVKSLADQLAVLESRYSNRPPEIAEHDTFSALKVALKPLEDATKALEAEKKRLEALADLQEASLSPIREGLQMLAEDARSRIAESDNCIQQKDLLHKQLTEIRRGHEAECDRFLEEHKARENLAKILKQKTEVSNRIGQIQQKLVECVKQENSTKGKLGSLTPQTPLYSDVNKMERMINAKCLQTVKIPLNQLLGDISRDHGFNLELTVLREQVYQMDQREFALLDQWKTQRDTDQEALDQLQPGTLPYNQLQGQMARRRQQQASYEAMITTWKKQVKSALDEARNAPNPIADDVFRSEFQTRVVRLLPDDQKDETAKLFDKFVEALAQPPPSETRSLRAKAPPSEFVTLTESFQALQFMKTSLESEKGDLQKELLGLSSAEKGLRAICDSNYTRNQSAVKKSLAQTYSSDEYNLVVKAFGKKALEKLSTGSQIPQARSGLHSKFDELYSAYLLCEQHSETHKKACEILERLRDETEGLYHAYVESHGVTLNQIEAISEAEQELINRTEAITEQKLQEIRLSVKRSRFTRDSKTQDLTGQIYKWHEKASEQRIKLSESEQRHEAAVRELAEQEAEVAKQREEMDKQLAHLKVSKQQLGTYEKQLRELEESEEVEPLRRTQSCTELDMEYPALKNEAKTYIFNEVNPGLPDFKLDLSSGFRLDTIKPTKFANCSEEEADFFMAVQPLLEGGTFYKKFSQKSSLVCPEFDPLEADVFPPEKCGYGLRELKLNRALTKIEVRQPNKPGIESSIMVEKLLEPIVPQHTLAILKTQKSAWLSGQQPPEDEELKRKYQEFKRMGIMDFQSPIFESKCMGCSHYVFFIALERGGRVELVADSYVQFKKWLEGVRQLFICKKLLPKLKFKIA